MQTRSRILIGILLVVGMALCSLVAGMLIGSRFVPPGSGLAGPAIAAGYGMVAALLGGSVAVLMAARLSRPWLIRTTIPVAILGGLCLALLTWSYLQSKAEQQAHLAEAYRRLPAFRLRIANSSAHRDGFIAFSADWAERFHAVKMDSRECADELTGPDAVRLLGALRELGGVMLRHGTPCEGLGSEPLYEIEWRIDETRSPESIGRLSVNALCLERHPALGAPRAAVDDLVRAIDRRTCVEVR